MKSWVLKDIKKITLIEATNDNLQLNAESSKIKVSISSIAPSDVNAYLGNYEDFKAPKTIGRSAVGLVSESPGDTLKKGQKVFLSPYKKNDFGKYITAGIDFDGYCCDYITLPLSSIYELPDSISEKEAIFIDDIAIADATMDKLDIKTSEYILLIGASYKNLIAAQIAIYHQAIPIVLDDSQERLQLAEDLGVYYTINANDNNVKSRIKDITSGKFVNYLIFDTDAFNKSEEILSLIGRNGKLCLTGFNRYPENIILNASSLISNEIQIFGSNTGEGYISSAIQLLVNKAVSVNKLIGSEYEFSNLNNSIKTISTKLQFLKTLIYC